MGLKIQYDALTRPPNLAVEWLKTAHRASLTELDALFTTLQHRTFRGELFGVPSLGVPPSGGKAHERKKS